MQLKFLGVGSAFTTTEYYQSNMLITADSGRRMLIDCGSDIRFALAENHINLASPEEKNIDIYISHLHADHIGGLEWLAYQSYFNPAIEKPILHMEEELMKEMWEHSLKGGLKCIQDKVMQLEDYFDCRFVEKNGVFCWEGLEFELCSMPHVVSSNEALNSHGLVISRENDLAGKAIFVSTDTIFQSELLNELANKVSLMFHDCETASRKTGVHAHYEELCTLPEAVKNKMWLYHYQPHPSYDPKGDGFNGFVVKGQDFELL